MKNERLKKIVIWMILISFGLSALSSALIYIL